MAESLSFGEVHHHSQRIGAALEGGHDEGGDLVAIEQVEVCAGLQEYLGCLLKVPVYRHQTIITGNDYTYVEYRLAVF